MLFGFVFLVFYFAIVVPFIFWGYDIKNNCYQTRKDGRLPLVPYYKSVYSLRWIGFLAAQVKYEWSGNWDRRYPWFDDNPKYKD